MRIVRQGDNAAPMLRCDCDLDACEMPVGRRGEDEDGEVIWLEVWAG